MNLKRLALALALGLFLSGQALAHDFNATESMDLSDILTVEHGDDDPWAGWINLDVTNTGDVAWGDFHFEIYQVTNYGSVENVDFRDDGSFAPTSSQTGLTWDLDNSVTGSTLDLYFYDDPVAADEQATFSVYTDNTIDKLDFFGVSFHPTPVPVPAPLLLLGTGLIGLIGFRRTKTA